MKICQSQISRPLKAVIVVTEHRCFLCPAFTQTVGEKTCMTNEGYISVLPVFLKCLEKAWAIG